VVYRKSQYAHTHAPCGNAEHGASATSATDTARAAATPPGQTTYGAERLVLTIALSATTQYAQSVSGESPSNLDAYLTKTTEAMVVALNRVNEVFLNTFAMTLALMPGNDVLISRSASDAISSVNSDALALLNANPGWTLDAHGVSPTAFNLGHVLSTAPGGVSSVGSACVTNAYTRCRASSGRSSPSGDPFFIDIFAHDLGHQFGAHHTFNGV